MFVNGWMLASRIRFALVQTAMVIGFVLVIGVLSRAFDTREGIWFAVGVVLIAFVLNWWVWYPIAKRKFTPRQR